MVSEADKAIIHFLDEHSGKALQICLLSELRARWNEGYLYSRLRTLQSRGHLVKERDSSGHVLLVMLQAPEVSA